MSLEIGFAQNPVPGKLQIVGANFRQKLDLSLFNQDIRTQKITTVSRDMIYLSCGHFHLFVLQQAASEFGLRIGHLFARIRMRHGQKQLALDLHKMRRHRKIIGRKLQIAFADQLHITHVLFRNDRHRNLHDVELLPANEIKQKIEWTFEAFQKHSQRIGRNVKPFRNFKKRLSVEARKRHAVNGLRRRILSAAGIYQIGKRELLGLRGVRSHDQ